MFEAHFSCSHYFHFINNININNQSLKMFFAVRQHQNNQLEHETQIFMAHSGAVCTNFRSLSS